MAVKRVWRTATDREKGMSEIVSCFNIIGMEFDLWHDYCNNRGSIFGGTTVEFKIAKKYRKLLRSYSKEQIALAVEDRMKDTFGQNYSIFIHSELVKHPNWLRNGFLYVELRRT